MKANLEDISKNPQQLICPHLALKGDVESYAAFPSSINACYRCHQPVTPNINHQRSYCLSSNYLNCQLLQNEGIKKFPKDLKYRKNTWFGNLNVKKLIGLSGIVLIIVLITVISGSVMRKRYVGVNETPSKNMDLSSTNVNSSNHPSDDTPHISESSEVDVIADATEKLPTVSTEPPTQTKTDPILALDTPIGGEYQFIIHRVLEGESLQYLADLHNTNTDAIVRINKNLITPLWVGWVVIIPVNIENVNELPAFTAHQIEEKEISVSGLAEKFDVLADEIAFYNNIDPGHILHEGEWLVISSN